MFLNCTSISVLTNLSSGTHKRFLIHLARQRSFSVSNWDLFLKLKQRREQRLHRKIIFFGSDKSPNYGDYINIRLSKTFQKLSKILSSDFSIAKTLVTIILFMLIILMKGEAMHVVKEYKNNGYREQLPQ